MFYRVNSEENTDHVAQLEERQEAARSALFPDRGNFVRTASDGTSGLFWAAELSLNNFCKTVARQCNITVLAHSPLMYVDIITSECGPALYQAASIGMHNETAARDDGTKTDIQFEGMRKAGGQ